MDFKYIIFCTAILVTCAPANADNSSDSEYFNPYDVWSSESAEHNNSAKLNTAVKAGEESQSLEESRFSVSNEASSTDDASSSTDDASSVVLNELVDLPGGAWLNENIGLFDKIKGEKALLSENNAVFGIIGGEKASITDVNYIGSLSFEARNRPRPLGSVVIISNRWVLTAASLVKSFSPDKLVVRVGSNYGNQDGTLEDVSDKYLHPNYTHGQYSDDIALLKLAENLTLSGSVQPIPLATELPDNNEHVNVSGYGYNKRHGGNVDHLQQVLVTFLETDSCQEHYSENLNDTICTSDDGAGPCSYDVGSPLEYNGELIGVFIGNKKCASSKYPAVYNDITKLNDWINNTISNNGDNDSDNKSGSNNKHRSRLTVLTKLKRKMSRK